MKKEAFFDRDESCYFFEAPDKIAAFCKENHEEECAHIIRVADEVCDGYFLFDLKWDMERTYEPVIFKSNINWNYMPKGDPEFIWQFNRHRFFICLGQAYALTGDEKYAKTFTSMLMQWVKNVPLNETFAQGPWRSLETGIRGENWNKALRYFKDSPYVTEEFLDIFYQSMIEHAEHLVASHSPYRYMSNWGVIENHGLFEIAMMLPQSEKTRKYRAFALKNLEIEAKMEIMADGTQWEQSPMYHNEVLHCYYDVIILAKRNKVVLPEVINEQIKKMVYADVIWMKPNHHQPLMGDSDDTDIRDMISEGAYLFQDEALRSRGLAKIDFEAAWDIGMTGIAYYARMKEKELNFTSAQLQDSGNYFFRSSWEEDANYLRLHCGTIGAGHGHSDQLHIDLTVKGEDVLVDAGRYTYVSGKDRFAFKDPNAHNTLLVDGKSFTVCKDSWECSKLSQPVKQQFVLKDDFGFVQAGHLGYMDEAGVFVNRKVIVVHDAAYILVDELYAKDAHTYEQYFHFNEVGKVILKNNEVHYEGKAVNVVSYFLTPGVQIERVASRISHHYNEAKENEAIKVKLKGEGFTSMVSVMAEEGTLLKVEKVPVESALKTIVYPSAFAEAIKMTMKQGEEIKSYIIVICHQEVNTPTDLVKVEDCMGYGNIIVFDESEPLVGTVLNW